MTLRDVYWLLISASPYRARASRPSAPLRNGIFLPRRSHPSLKTEGNPPRLGFERPVEDDLECCARAQNEILAPRQKDSCGSRCCAGDSADSDSFNGAAGNPSNAGSFDCSLADGFGVVPFTGIAFNRCFALALSGAARAGKGSKDGDVDPAGEYEGLETQRQFSFAFHLSRPVDFADLSPHERPFGDDDLVVHCNRKRCLPVNSVTIVRGFGRDSAGQDNRYNGSRGNNDGRLNFVRINIERFRTLLLKQCCQNKPSNHLRTPLIPRYLKGQAQANI